LAKPELAVALCQVHHHTLIFFLYTKDNMTVVAHFNTSEVITAESQAVLNTLTEHDFQDAFKNWQKCWELCILMEWHYLEGNGGQ
jgi:hypothetical protein